MKLSEQIRFFKTKENLTENAIFHMNRINKDISRCSAFTLYRQDVITDKISLVASVPCGNKLCFICNWQRQKRTRRKYFSWFKDNPQILELYKPLAGKSVFTTQTRFNNNKHSGYVISARHNYDLMHLTLTVPHTAEHGFKGNHYYFQDLAAAYWLMRKVPEFNQMVFGGEYGIETTFKTNGLHIHIHSLLLVRQKKQNRNILHKIILREWNRLTADPGAKRKEFAPGTLELICKSNKLLSLQDAAALDPTGATMITLETLYSFDKEGNKVRTSEFGSDQMLKGVMEAISYHFEPTGFDKENKTFDLQLISKIAPEIYKKPLYKKFGCLHGEKSLNISDDETDIEQDYAEAASIVNEDTGEIINESSYFICNPAYIFHIPAKDYEISVSNAGKKKSKPVDAINTADAVRKMGIMVQSVYKRK